jgi:hypothetical protein
MKVKPCAAVLSLKEIGLKDTELEAINVFYGLSMLELFTDDCKKHYLNNNPEELNREADRELKRLRDLAIVKISR